MKPTSSAPAKSTEKLSSDLLKSEMAAESRAEFYISPGVSEQAAIRAALQNDGAYRADEAPRLASPQLARKSKIQRGQAA